MLFSASLPLATPVEPHRTPPHEKSRVTQNRCKEKCYGKVDEQWMQVWERRKQT